MSTQRPTFKVVKNGYDRFAVDDAVERYASRVDDLERRVAAYEQELSELKQKMSSMKAHYAKLQQTLSAEKKAADNLTRISLKEANEIIETAQRNADTIVSESLKTARTILSDLAQLYNDADIVKEETKMKLNDLVNELDQITLPRMPDIEWLREAEEKMR